MGLNLEEMESATRSTAPQEQEYVTHVAIVEDEETGRIERMPLRFCLGHGGTLTIRHYPPKREDPDFHLGAVGTE